MTRRRALLVLPAVFVARCGSPPPPPPPPTLALMIAGGADQNPSATGAASTVAVHIYQLAASAKFERADVFGLIEREMQTLGTDDLASEEFTISPSQSRTISHELKTGTQFIGVAVLFRDIDNAKWRLFAPAAAHGPTKLTLAIKGLTATLAPT